MTPILDLQHVSFHYGKRNVLTDATFSLAPGTATALIGPNGAGKTTLLRLASGVLKPGSGSIHFNGAPIAALSPRLAARQIAIVPQTLEVPFDYTVQEVVEQGRTPHRSLLGRLSPTDRREVERALELTNTASLRDRVFNELSGGERQRVKIALGLAQQPRLLLLDEPTQNLDIGRQVELLDLLRRLQADGLTLLAAIHDLHLIEGTFSSVVLLQANVPPLFGPPSQILEQSLLEQAFDCPTGNHPLFKRATLANPPGSSLSTGTRPLQESVMSIATKRGDTGETGLIGDIRISKASLRVEAYGSVDELNSALGFARSLCPDPEISGWTETIQRTLFRLGADLSVPPGSHSPAALKPEDVTFLTDLVYTIEAVPGILSDWSLPGAHTGSAAFEVARTTCRRVERNTVRLMESGEQVSPDVLAYLNRLSDLIWLFGRQIEFKAGIDARLRDDPQSGPGWSRAW